MEAADTDPITPCCCASCASCSKRKRRFSCAVIGGSAMTVSCGSWLLARGHHIAWVLPRGKEVAEWAVRNNIPTCSHIGEVHALNTEIDYLFSIVNDLVLDEAFLSIPRRFGINYHNALLPAYAGVFATSWAILNNETKHGITWHAMNEKVDAGDILVQRELPVGEGDTAYSLNLACQSAAVAAFREELVPALEAGIPLRRSQPPGRRVYYPLHRKPPGGGLLVWEEDAAFLAQMVRALCRGPIVNSFELAKFPFGNAFMVVNDLERVSESREGRPGTILQCTAEGLVIATGTGAVRVRSLGYPDGKQVPASEWCRQAGLTRGDRLPCASRELAVSLQRKCEAMAVNELFCVQAWQEAYRAAYTLPAAYRKEQAAVAPVVLSFERPSYDIMSLAIIALGLLLTAASDTRAMSLLFSSAALRRQCAGLEPFVNACLPLTFALEASRSIRELQYEVALKLKEMESRGLHGKDLLTRRKIPMPPAPMLSVDVCEHHEGCPPPDAQLSKAMAIISRNKAGTVAACRNIIQAECAVLIP